ncbi:MAG: CehA/McbA family metallohydrolase [Acidobacteria bacterium]|nr:CehA/McbA family metallohydrolase [Acidobacteriota bacterium]MBI3280261.1 CehA/McbA family metallohydrolase [Acidobacteriota bacterium]
MVFPLLVVFTVAAEELPLVSPVEHQPLAAQVTRLLDALDMLSDPLPAEDTAALRKLVASPGSAAAIEQIQRILDRHVLVGVNINPEMRVKAQQGAARPELMQNGWRTFLIKVHNEAGTTAVLAVTSPNAGPHANAPNEGIIRRRFLDLQLWNKQPLKPHLSGLELEYRILQVFSRDAGKREGKLIFDVGQGSQDLGFRSEADVLFTAKPATKVTLRVLDSDDKPTTAAFLVRDSRQRVYPSQAKRLPPDFFFHPQVYRADGESLALPAGEYTVAYSRGPEYRQRVQKITVGSEPLEITFRLERWVDPAKFGWFSGDHHVHAAGCSHFERPTEGVYPKDMWRHILGEDLKVGAVLTWGPGWYFQKTFFEGKDNQLSSDKYKMHYDVEVSGFPSSHTGHIVLLGLKEQDYPGTKRIEEWPSWGVPVFKWAKSQNAVAGFAHSGWGLQIKDTNLPSQEMPRFDGIGANEFVVGVTHDAVDFISAVDTPAHWELNVWYHTLNAGYRTRISGETDFPCIYDEKVGLGRSYVRQKTNALEYRDWIEGIREGRNYVSDGKSHIFDFKVDDLGMGENGSELALRGSANVRITARVAALLQETPDETVRRLPLDHKPYWDLERARIGNSRKVPVELIVNGVPAARAEIEADGTLRPIAFTQKVERSSWIALRILPSSHTNPIFVQVGGKPIRGSRKSIEWCLRAVDQCAQMKMPRIRLEERGEAERAYEYARQAYRKRLAEAEAE